MRRDSLLSHTGSCPANRVHFILPQFRRSTRRSMSVGDGGSNEPNSQSYTSRFNETV
jgi:hypothetical protein